MLCAARTRGGDRCTRFARYLSVYCVQHGAQHGWNPARTSQDGRRILGIWGPTAVPVPPVPRGPLVPPDLMARVLKISGIPHSYRRMLAVEFCEAFAEADTAGEFDPHGFLAAADVEAERRV